MNQIKSIINIISGAIYICIVGFLLIAAPMVAGFRPVVVLSGSMEPTYHVGSVIYYKSTPYDNINVGDPITFTVDAEGTMVTHRVTQKQEASQEFTTQGDANPTEDTTPVAYNHVVGKASSFCIPYAGYAVGFAKQKMVIIPMAAVLIFSILLDTIFPDKKKKESEQ